MHVSQEQLISLSYNYDFATVGFDCAVESLSFDITFYRTLIQDEYWCGSVVSRQVCLFSAYQNRGKSWMIFATALDDPTKCEAVIWRFKPQLDEKEEDYRIRVLRAFQEQQASDLSID
jgi:hypothetical protein